VSGDPKSWLYSALKKVNLTGDELKVTSADFADEAVAKFAAKAFENVAEPNPADEWAPNTIDESDPVVADATKQLNAATEAIEQDNGYSATHPQERDAVVQDLNGGLD
jgi:hypothetical protein